VILDTNALSAIADGEEAAVKAVGAAREVAIPVIVLGEFRFGIGQSKRRAEYELWLSRGLANCTILAVGAETAEKYAEIRLDLKRAGTPIPSNDAWIAALSREHGLPILSQDRHFDLVKGIRRVSW
jgi:tRNA(fMet)-specific endonuclease VapC